MGAHVAYLQTPPEKSLPRAAHLGMICTRKGGTSEASVQACRLVHKRGDIWHYIGSVLNAGAANAEVKLAKLSH